MTKKKPQTKIELELPSAICKAIVVTLKDNALRHLLESIETLVAEFTASSNTLTSVRINQGSDNSFALLIIGDAKVFANNVRDRIIDRGLAFSYVNSY
jgi:hypothetical protein